MTFIETIRENPLQTALVVLTLVWAEQCILPIPNTYMDRVMAKEVWCHGPATRTDGSIKTHVVGGYQYSEVDVLDVKYSSSSLTMQLDHIFTRSRVGDFIQFGSIDPEDNALLELKVVDSRPQWGTLGPNEKGTADSMMHLECPGYIKMNAYFNGKPIEGGQGIEMVYAMKLWTSGGMFDGLPDYSLEDVLDMTSSSGKEQKAMLADAMVAAKKQQQRGYDRKIQAENAIAREQYEARLQADVMWAGKVQTCHQTFSREGDKRTLTYTVRKGDNVTIIQEKVNDCNDSHAFFPDALFFDTPSWQLAGFSDSQTRSPLSSEMIYPGQQLLLEPKYTERALVQEYLPKK